MLMESTSKAGASPKAAAAEAAAASFSPGEGARTNDQQRPFCCWMLDAGFLCWNSLRPRFSTYVVVIAMYHIYFCLVLLVSTTECKTLSGCAKWDKKVGESSFHLLLYYL